MKKRKDSQAAVEATREWPEGLSMELPSLPVLAGMLMFSSLGMWAIKMGRRDSNIKVLLLGFVLVGYSYFTPQAWLVWLIGVALTVGVFVCREQ